MGLSLNKCRINSRQVPNRVRILLAVLFMASTLFWLKVDINVGDSIDSNENQLIAERSVCQIPENRNNQKTSSPDFTLKGHFFQNTLQERPLARFKIEPKINIDKVKVKHCEKFKEKPKWSIANFVKSSISNKKRRDVIRATWGAVKLLDGIRFEVVFVVGKSPTEEEEEAIKLESEKYGDILQVDIEESAKSVPLKVLASMQWSSDNLPSDWIYSSLDDDVVLHVINILTYINSLVDPVGSIKPTETDIPCPEKLPLVCIYAYKKDDMPDRQKNSKFYLSYEKYPNKTFPAYCRGGMYSASNRMVSELFKVSRKTDFLYLDDVWITGFMRLRLKNKEVDIMGAPHAFRSNTDLYYDRDNTHNVLMKHLFGNFKQYFFSRLVDVEKKLHLVYDSLGVDFTQHDVCFAS